MEIQDADHRGHRSRPAAAAPETRLLKRATISAALLAAAIFAADLVTPRGAGLGALYVVPLLVGTLSGAPRFQLVAALVASLLTIAGGWLSPQGVAGVRAAAGAAV